MATISPALSRILDLARWAPSGDNTQPWRFEVLGPEHVLVHGFDTRDHVVYDLDGHASHLAIGGLLETITIAATTEGYTAHFSRRSDAPDTHLLIDVHFEASANPPDPLSAYITERVVQRRPMSRRGLSLEQKQTLEKTLPPGYQVAWFEGPQRWQLARFMFDNAKIRLIIPEAYQVHKSVIEWTARFSETKIPGQAVGVDPLTLRFMQWAMASWQRVEFFNKWLLGDLPPRLQLDLIPGWACAAHYALFAPTAMQTVDDYLSAGRVMQRFWLVATQLGLFVQPQMTPVIFTRYHRAKHLFTVSKQANALVSQLDQYLLKLINGKSADRLFFMGRMGFGPKPTSRSIRQPLTKLFLNSSDS